jgi:hypothetical protein
MLFFFVKETASNKNGIEAVFNNIADEYHGCLFQDLNHVLEFMDVFIKRLTDFRNESFSEKDKHPKIHFAPSSLKRDNWIDITIWVEGIITCKIIKANDVLIAK